MAEDNLKRVKELLDSINKEKKSSEAKLEQERRSLVMSVGKQIVDALKPLLAQLVNQGKVTKQDIKDAISQVKIDVDVPEIKVPEIRVPEPRVTVRPPIVNVPEIVMPDEMNVRGFVQLMGVDLQNPLPVQLRTADGDPLNLFENLTTLISGGGGGGGKRDYFTIRGFSQSAYAELTNPDGRLRVSVETGASGLTDSELRASSVPVAQVSGALWSVAVKEIFGSTVTTLFNGDNRIPVSVETGGSGLTDSELRATSVPVSQVSGSAWSTYITGSSGTVFSYLVDADGSYRSTLPVEGTVTVQGTLTSTGAYLLNGDGTYRDTVAVEGSLSSVVAVGDIPSDTADTGSAPLKIGGIARTANPTAVANGDRVSATYDDVGRQLVRPFQVRDLTVTAYATLSADAETTLLAGAASTFHDMVYVMGANQSDAAVTIDIRSGTGGSVISSLEIPANATAGVAPALPIPQTEVAQAWTVDFADSDITGTTVDFTALFTKEV